MRSYPGKKITEERRIFNYQQRGARRVTENRFGIFSSRWRIFRTIIGSPKKAVVITKAACCLHNHLQLQNKLLLSQGRYYGPPHYIDGEDQRGNVIPGRWRFTAEIASSSGLQDFGRPVINTHSREAIHKLLYVSRRTTAVAVFGNSLHLICLHINTCSSKFFFSAYHGRRVCFEMAIRL